MLPEGRKESLLPAFGLDCRTHFGARFILRDACPHISIAAIGGHVQSIHNRHATRRLTVSFHIHAMRAPLSSGAEVECNGHGNRIRQRNAVFPGLFQVSLSRGTRVG